MNFPENVTDEERGMDWRKIAEIKDADFGFNDPRGGAEEVRFCVRILLFNDRGEICVVKSEKYGYM